ncbi:hypothetical protein B0H15DRAFT_1001789 [Mycena belliarum]|uniref:DUF6699 domain-containing protein n=1 Tax=Mycena belliarum TaxID=1033014 RepID=A0AAD6TUG5_9AGAR|nr:hypothetical protein B0H15DRAFT_1001789 [Mycena belliae]
MQMEGPIEWIHSLRHTRCHCLYSQTAVASRPSQLTHRPMPFLSAQDKYPKPSRAASSLLRRFNDLYRPSTSTTVSSATKSKPESTKAPSLYQFDPPVHVSLFTLDNQELLRDFSGDSESNSSHSDASSSRQTLELTPVAETRPSAYLAPAHPHIKPLRPALKQSTSSSASSAPFPHSASPLHVSFATLPRPDPDPTHFTMHPLFQYTHLEHAPISCDLLYAPSPRTVLDRSTRAPIPDAALDAPATEPPLYAQLVLQCPLLPWNIVVRPGAAAPAPAPRRGYPHTRRRPITNRDVLAALHAALRQRATPDEWAALGARTRAQKRITRAYERRCVQLGGGWETGVRRVDWLDGRTRLVGIARKDGAAPGPGTATLIFKTPA